jgi:16S rRNA G966 N2-methylase RsmD
LLLADPPYRIDASEFSQVLEALASEGLLAAHALVVYEHAAARDMIWPHAFTPEPVRRYGDTAVSFATYEG